LDPEFVSSSNGMTTDEVQEHCLNNLALGLLVNLSKQTEEDGSGQGIPMGEVSLYR
jgi:hypothetical protein